MSSARDLYNYEGRTEKVLKDMKDGHELTMDYKTHKKLRRPLVISKRNVNLIIKFYNWKTAEQADYSKPRRYKLLIIMKKLAAKAGKDFDKMNKEDVVKLVSAIANNGYQPATVREYQVFIKMFWKWLKGEGLIMPKEVSWIKVCSDKTKKQAKDMITLEEHDKMQSKEHNARNGCGIAQLLEQGLRISELLSLKISDICISSDGFGELTVTGKTGTRTVSNMYISVPYLKRWLQQHPDGNNPNAWLYTKMNSPEPLGYGQMLKIVKAAAKRVGITKKVTNHLFRHSAITYWDKLGYTDQEKAKLAGWTSTKQLQTYSHIGNGQVRDKTRQIHGKKEKIESKPPTQLDCPSCSTVNPPNSKFCLSCGYALTFAAVKERQDKQEQALGMIDKEMLSDMIKKIVTESMNHHIKPEVQSKISP